MNRLPATLALAVVGALLFSSCKTKPIRFTTLSPTTVTTHVATDADEDDFSCWPFLCTCLCHLQVSCANVATSPGEVQVGDQRFWDFGTTPCNCEWYRNCVSRGWVVFDVSSLAGKGIVDASLKWTFRGQHVRSLWIGAAPPPGHSGTPWAFAPVVPGEKRSDFPTGSSTGGSVNVSDVVRDWVQNGVPNHGLVLVGPNESFSEFGNLTRLSTASGFSLEVQFTD